MYRKCKPPFSHSPLCRQADKPSNPTVFVARFMTERLQVCHLTTQKLRSYSLSTNTHTQFARILVEIVKSPAGGHCVDAAGMATPRVKTVA